ncbi:peptidoglycan DD-metalloendopeptidase family protein [Picosynechococcus sp. PCC 7117]|uniref:peptidoglycan DD-metalloendopeptidase family protein n=1 Tax=Picosynechococcus sp. PCC 7117 TaxID=195498 RepID=UPI00081076B6|nr:peptidoglycan DD-metalloendopeptidase family protein [Picosynechococcus sp. PCC 7117]ANV88500.1 hypothetical protein AWQ22_14090 [Picosynechococcus sp. PCC 7117]
MFNQNNPNPSQSLLAPYVRITLGNSDDEDKDVFITGDGKLQRCTVTLGEGPLQSNCQFSVYDPDKKLIDKYLAYVEENDGLDPVDDGVTSSTPIDTASSPTGNAETAVGQVIYQNVQATYYRLSSTTGTYGTVNYDANQAAMYNAKYANSVMKVTSLDTGKSVLVKIVDTGPFANVNGRAIRPLQEHPTRKIDLTPGAVRALGLSESQGVYNVNIEWVEADMNAAQAEVNRRRGAPGQWVNPPDLDQTSFAGLSNNSQVRETTRQISSQNNQRLPLVSATRTGTKNSNGLYIYNVTFKAVDEEFTIPMVSGVPSTQDSGQENVSGSLAPLPSGEYSLAPVVTSGGLVANPALGGVWAALTPKFSTNRTALGLHHDGGALGTAGCLATITLADRDRMVAFLRRHRPTVFTLGVTSAPATATNNAASSRDIARTRVIQDIPNTASRSGGQILIEMGFNGESIVAYSFLHTGITYDLFKPDELQFSGQAANWVLTRRSKNTAYTNITLRKLAKKITSYYGLNLEMEDEGPTYEYFPQRGQSDYDALLIEARRLGYRVYTKGNTLYIRSRDQASADKEVFFLEYGDNLGTQFTLNHTASTDSSGGARSSTPGANNKTGIRKYEIDPTTGQINQTEKENPIGTGQDELSVTGSPIVQPQPKSTEALTEEDNLRVDNENRVKGITAQASAPTTPEALLVDPDTPLRTKNISKTIDRFWVVDSVTHNYDLGYMTTNFNLYSPLKNKRPTTAINSNPITNTNNGQATSFNPNSPQFINPLPNATFTSPYGPRGGRLHAGVDISSRGGSGAGSPILAAASGTVTFAGFGNSSNGYSSYGNIVVIDHGGGWTTRYAHLSSISVNQGAPINQGATVGIEGSTGRSTGTHLHFEIRKNGTAVNPEQYVKLR